MTLACWAAVKQEKQVRTGFVCKMLSFQGVVAPRNPGGNQPQDPWRKPNTNLKYRVSLTLLRLSFPRFAAGFQVAKQKSTKRSNVRNFSAPNSRAGSDGCADFVGAWDFGFWLLSAGKPPCPSNSSFFSAGVFGFLRGGCQSELFYYYGCYYYFIIIVRGFSEEGTSNL